MNIKNNLIRVSGAIVFKDQRGKRSFLLVKQGNEDKWEIPKVTARKGESSVRAAIRMIGELAGINARILEEAGRGSGTATINGRTIPQRLYYYLMVQRAASEVIGFEKYEWLDFERAYRSLSLKREKDMLRQAKYILKKWEKEKPKSL
ncbi:hypothetical protein A2210_02835 [Candidatus Woesebacteria bacterium RIFOXYA1_FULL_40_18]|uniref:Nudix hydrolase domain-containing protein n=1 Tax=Candidatus Woesebacteria bacterium RIFOXYA1_FULL_40_18 TaxID=1802532 RepID=A0A1F8CLT1_9BACT|nr:MAG: hypothetical protein A2210_02835 [Candidatus Woesebacteria bacterium RIFOXYA1_FULL_40_18]